MMLLLVESNSKQTASHHSFLLSMETIVHLANPPALLNEEENDAELRFSL